MPKTPLPRATTLSLLLEHRRRRQVRHQKGLRAAARQTALTFTAVTSLLLAMGLLVFGAGYVMLTKDLPSLETLPLLLEPVDGLMQQPTRFYDRSGKTVLFALENSGVEHDYLSLDPQNPAHFSPKLIQAVIALQEPDFWSSPGFSFTHLAKPEPYSLAESLVNDLLLSKEENGLPRALRMRLLAAQLTAVYGRAQVLEWYLNSAYFGHLAYGADHAARLYLGKPAGELNLAESALLVSLISTPSLNPLDAPRAVLERMEEVLDQLQETGLFDPGDLEEARLAQLDFMEYSAEPADEFFTYAQRQLETLIDRHQIERGGLKVITTLDASMAQTLTCTIQIQLQRLQGDPSAGLRSDAASTCDPALLLPTLPAGTSLPAELLANGMVLDPQSGEILAYAGARTLSDPAEMMIRYQPGSLLTPFVTATAFVRGMSPASLVWDVPYSTEDLPRGTFPPVGEIENPDGQSHGPQRLRTALANDYLIAFARLVEQVGSQNVGLLAKTLGLPLSDQVEFNASLLASGGEVSLPEVAQAYSTFANLGSQSGWKTPGGVIEPISILGVQDLHGHILYEHQSAESTALLTPALAYLVQDVLSDEAARRPSLGHPNGLEIGRPAGAKIGQVAGNQQVWAVGYTPELLTVVWLGLPEGLENQSEETLLTPAMAAGIWHAVMQYALQGQPVQGWQQPGDIVRRTVCSPSGLLPNSDCPLKVSEIFLLGNEPNAYDTLYRTFSINRETGRLATVFTPLELIEQQTLLVVPPEYQDWAAASGLPLPPSDYDLIQAQNPSAQVAISSPGAYSPVRGKVIIEGTASGEDFDTYRLQIGEGLNPRTWLQIGSDSARPVEKGVLGVWDTQSLNGLYVIRLSVLRSGNRFESHLIQVSVDNTPPQAVVTYPSALQQFGYTTSGEILFLAEAADAMGIERLEWLLDGKTIAESSAEPYYLAWKMTPGEHTLQVKAYDLAGNSGESQEIAFTVTQQ